VTRDVGAGLRARPYVSRLTFHVSRLAYLHPAKLLIKLNFDVFYNIIILSEL